MGRVDPWAMLERDEVIRRLEATRSRDPDVLHAAKLAMLRELRVSRWLGVGLVLAGSLSGAWLMLVWVALPAHRPRLVASPPGRPERGRGRGRLRRIHPEALSRRWSRSTVALFRASSRAA